MQTKYPSVFYITRDTYNDIASQGAGPEKVFELVQKNYDSKNLSELTKANVINVNSLVSKVLFSNSHIQCTEIPRNINISKDEETYSKENAKFVLIEEEMSLSTRASDSVDGDSAKCYEIIPYTTSVDLFLIVVVDVGFLSVVTETKEKLLQHFLSILRHCYDNKAFFGFVVHEYLGLKLSDNFFNLVLNRLDRH